MQHEFDWDQWNSQKSYLKHGITNYEAESCFKDAHKIIWYDLEHSVHELRYICIGKSEFGNVIFSAFTFRRKKIRIISSRPANRKERMKYAT